MSDVEQVYTGATGHNCLVNGEHGYVTGFIHDGPHIVAAFVKIPPEDHRTGEPARMLHVMLGRTTRQDCRAVASACEITRDEFDRLTTLDQLRHDLGWRA